MGGDLTQSKAGDLTHVIATKELGEIIKPLTNEVHLFDTHIAGTSHLKDKSILDKVQVDDILTLQREDSKFDTKAILTLTEESEKLGYIPEKDNAIFSRLMDAGKLLKAKIVNIEHRKNYANIRISIFLVDF